MSRRSQTEEMTAHLRSLKRYALVLARNSADADDLVQETLLRALSAAETFREGADMRVWLFRIMHNAHVSSGRRAQTRAAYLDAQSTLETPAAPATQHDRLEVKAVIEALDRLPEPQREAVALMALEDIRYADAAKVLGVPLGTFMSRISRGREALRRLVEGAGRNQPTPEGAKA
jgi:RNA polymerase sigma-70 factor (ECF subfamily)